MLPDPSVSLNPKRPLPGGRLALDFANLRLASSFPGGPQELLRGLLAFLSLAGVIQASAIPALAELWANAPNEASSLLNDAVSLNRALRILFQARIDEKEILPRWVAPLNELLAHTEGHDRLEPLPEHAAGQADWRLALHARAEGLEWLLTAIARSAAELIAAGPRAPIRKCANPDCGLFFYDASRTGKRRWCSMAVCGNRAKVAAHYRRAKNKS